MTRRGRPRSAPGGGRRAQGRPGRGRALVIGGALLAVALVALFAERLSGGRVRIPWSMRAASTTAGAPGARATPALALDTPHAYLDAAMAANSAREFSRLLDIVDEGLERFPNDPSLLLARGAALNNLSFRVERTRGRLVPGLATSLERVRAAQGALAAYDDVARRFPAVPEPVGELGLVLVTWGLPEDGRRALERAYDLGDRRAEVLNALGVVDRTQRSE